MQSFLFFFFLHWWLSNSAYVISTFSSNDGQSWRNVQQVFTKLGSLSVGVVKESVTLSSEGLLFRGYLEGQSGFLEASII